MARPWYRRRKTRCSAEKVSRPRPAMASMDATTTEIPTRSDHDRRPGLPAHRRTGYPTRETSPAPAGSIYVGDGLDRFRRDALLVVRTQLGDRRALAELVEHWHGPVWRYARRMLGGARSADDPSQDAWGWALKALPRSAGAGAVRAVAVRDRPASCDRPGGRDLRCRATGRRWARR